MLAKILKKHWTLRYVPTLGGEKDGDCDAPETPHKEIRIVSGLSDRRHLEVLIHECLHAGYWAADEEIISELAENIATIIWKRGYRRQDNHEAQRKSRNQN